MGVSDTTKTYILLGIILTSAIGGLVSGFLLIDSDTRGPCFIFWWAGCLFCLLWDLSKFHSVCCRDYSDGSLV